jgi:hypothetical protein
MHPQEIWLVNLPVGSYGSVAYGQHADHSPPL